MPRISVIVPVYKVEKYLHECIDSILSQTFSDFELLLIDDGSPDKCGEICDAYATTDKRVKVIHQKNRGLSAARNSGLDIACGRFVTFIDSDDVVNIYYLEALYRMHIQYNADVVVSSFSSFINCYAQKEQCISEDVICMSSKGAVLSVYSSNVDRIPIVSCGKLYDIRLFDAVRFPIGKIHEDQYVTPIVLYMAKRVVWLKAPIYGYRKREGSIMNVGFSLNRFDSIEAMDYCISFFNMNYEMDLSNVVAKAKKESLSYCSLLARKAGIYYALPMKYRMSRFQALYILKKNLPYEVYEYRLYPVYPTLIRIEAYIRKLLRIMRFKI